jgi:hypothetical protein
MNTTSAICNDVHSSWNYEKGICECLNGWTKSGDLSDGGYICGVNELGIKILTLWLIMIASISSCIYLSHLSFFHIIDSRKRFRCNVSDVLKS